MNLKRFYFTLFFLLVLHSNLFAALSFQDTSLQEVFQEMVEEGIEEMVKRNSIKSLQILSKAEILAKENNWLDKLCKIKNLMGINYNNLFNQGEALKNYLECYEIALQNPELIEEKINILNNIGSLYFEEKSFEKALEFYLKGYNLTKEIDYTHRNKAILASNIARIYHNNNNLDSAYHYLMEVKAERVTARGDQIWRVTHGENLYLKGKLDEARKELLELFEETSTDKMNEFNNHILLHLSKISELEGDIDKALEEAELGLYYNSYIRGIFWRLQLFEHTADLYYKNEEFHMFKSYMDSVIVIKDSISIITNKGLFESNKIKFQVLEYQNEIIQNKNKQRAERNLFLTIMFFMLIIGFLVFKVISNRMIKHKQAKIIAENKQKISEFEVEGLKNNISQKNRELSTKALYMSGRNELIQDIIISLIEIKEVTQNRELQNYIRNLKSHLKTDAEWDEFIKHFEQVNPEFISTLKSKFPDLSSNDIRFICYVYMNLNLKEISIIFNITYNAAKKRKQRIKEKFNIDKEDSLYDFLLKMK